VVDEFPPRAECGGGGSLQVATTVLPLTNAWETPPSARRSKCSTHRESRGNPRDITFGERTVGGGRHPGRGRRNRSLVHDPWTESLRLPGGIHFPWSARHAGAPNMCAPVRTAGFPAQMAAGAARRCRRRLVRESTDCGTRSEDAAGWRARDGRGTDAVGGKPGRFDGGANVPYMVKA